MDWQKFTNEVESLLETELTEQGSLPGKTSAQIQRFTGILIQAANKHVGKVKPGKKTKLWLTPPVKAAIKQRNRLRRMVKTHRREWID